LISELSEQDMPVNRIKFLAALLLLAQLSYGQKVIHDYISRFLPVATELSVQYGIPISIILGVSILESGSGTSKNCRQLNNYFGITGRNRLKKRHSSYKQYATPEDSFRDFCDIMAGKRFYHRLQNNMHYVKWLNAMNHASYAGAKGVWISRISRIIVKHRLAQYDFKYDNN
jgi:flagellum-specific peptidoglycan hydrolase FlgJ